MDTQTADTHSAADVADTLLVWGVGAGVITIALFPLAVPILALTAVAVLPLLLPVVAVGLAVTLVAVPVLAARAIGRWAQKLRRTRLTERSPTPAHRGA